MRERGLLLSQQAVAVWPDLNVAPELLERAKDVELRRRIKARSVGEVAMSQRALHLFGNYSPPPAAGGGVSSYALGAVGAPAREGDRGSGAPEQTGAGGALRASEPTA